MTRPTKQPAKQALEPDIVVWEAATSDVKPLKKKRILPPQKLAPDERSKKPIKAKPEIAARASSRSAYDAKLDLHGMTEAGAHPVLMDFVDRQRKRGAQRLLIITGKGAGKAGVLKANVPRWLDVETIARYISAIELAPTNLGGDGAFIVRLKKPK